MEGFIREDWDKHIAQLERDLGEALTLLKRYEAAEMLLLRSYKFLQSDRLTLERLTALYEAWGRPDKARIYKDAQRRNAKEARSKK